MGKVVRMTSVLCKWSPSNHRSLADEEDYSRFRWHSVVTSVYRAHSSHGKQIAPISSSNPTIYRKRRASRIARPFVLRAGS